MGSPDYPTINVDKGFTKIAPTGSPFRPDYGWWLFCLVFFTIKVILLLLDPSPKVLMGDSGSYIWTALTGWIPPDRSYVYGYTIRWLAVWPGTFTPLLLAQAIASGVTAIIFAVICRRFFELSKTLSYSFGVLCALDPCQVVWERYVMTETFSLLIYVLVLYCSFLYLQNRRIWQLVVVQMLSVVLISFRMGYLLVVQACALLLPVIAFAPYVLFAFRDRSNARISRLSTLTAAGANVIASVMIMLVTHSAYKHVNGWLAGREPAYLYSTGLHLVSTWAPALEPIDAPDPRFRELIAQGYQFELKNARARNAQHFADGFLLDRWSKIEKDLRKRNDVAKQTAINALRHRPLQIMGLAVNTYLDYWNFRAIQRYARIDLGYAKLTEENVKILAERFGFKAEKDPRWQPLSLSQLYFVAAWPYYFIVLVSPLICAFATWVSRQRSFALLLFVHASILVVIVTSLSPLPCIRYLQPVSMLTLFGVAICTGRIASNRMPTPARVAS